MKWPKNIKPVPGRYSQNNTNYADKSRVYFSLRGSNKIEYRFDFWEHKNWYEWDDDGWGKVRREGFKAYSDKL